MALGRIKFHEFGREFYWSPASQVVTNSRGLIVAYDCYNLDAARTAARTYCGR